VKNKDPQIIVRRSNCLVCFWEQNKFIIENFITKKQTIVSSLISNILQQIDNYISKKDLLNSLQYIPYIVNVIDKLIIQNILIIKDSYIDKKEQMINKTWKWNLDAQYFHYSTKNILFMDDLQVENKSLTEKVTRETPPTPFKDYRTLGISLPGSFKDCSDDFWKVLIKRRTKRSFIRKSIKFDDFSKLLLWTWGKTHHVHHPAFGEFILRTSPSGGARHPIEVYPIVLRVKGIDPGIYHYSVRRHKIEPLKLGNFEKKVKQLCANQEWLQNAAVLFIMTAVLERSMWKYGTSHAYRVILLDAGHLGQTFHLVCTHLSLAPFTFAAFNDEEIEKTLGIDGVSEIPIYAASAGVPMINQQSKIQKSDEYHI